MSITQFIKDLKEGKKKIDIVLIGDDGEDYSDMDEDDCSFADGSSTYDGFCNKFYIHGTYFYMTGKEYYYANNYTVDDAGVAHSILHPKGYDGNEAPDEDRLEDFIMKTILEAFEKEGSSLDEEMEAYYLFNRFKYDYRKLDDIFMSIPFINSVEMHEVDEEPFEEVPYTEQEKADLLKELQEENYKMREDINDMLGSLERYPQAEKPKAPSEIKKTSVSLSDALKSGDFSDFFDDELDEIPDISSAKIIIDKIIDKLKEAKDYIDKNQPVLAEDNLTISGNIMADLAFILRMLNLHEDIDVEEDLQTIYDQFCKDANASGKSGTKEVQSVSKTTFNDLLDKKYQERFGGKGDRDADVIAGPGIIVSGPVYAPKKDPKSTSDDDDDSGEFKEDI